MSEEELRASSETGWAGRAERAFPFAAGVLFVWLLGWVWLSWPYSLDDALIHLRYADHLLHQHRITYDGVHASFGTSSLLYVALLALLRTVWTSPLLPRVVSTGVYLVLFAGLAVAMGRELRRRQASAASWLLALGLLAVMVAPSAVRWLDDGMETGLVFLDALSGVLLLRQLLDAKEASRAALRLALFAYGLLTVLLRVELLSLDVCLSAMALLASPPAARTRGRGGFVPWLPVLGGVAGAALIALTMHALLPDTALAKAFGAGAWQDTFRMTVVTLGSSFSFGIGLLLLWIASVAASLASERAGLADLVPNLLFPFVLLAAAARGQQIQGIRYFGWTLFFPLVWNLLRSAEAQRRVTARSLRVFAVLFLAALPPAFAWESGTFLRLFAGRGSALNAFREQHLEGLRGRPGIAEDVGFVGYFTQGDLCDPYGLVNGRAAARLKYAQRFDRCMAEHPVFAFGSREFLQKVTHAQSLRAWSVCGAYRFDNVRSLDVHYLVVAPGQVGAACPGRAQPIDGVLPGLV